MVKARTSDARPVSYKLVVYMCCAVVRLDVDEVFYFLESSGFWGWEAMSSRDLAISGGVVGTTLPTAW